MESAPPALSSSSSPPPPVAPRSGWLRRAAVAAAVVLFVGVGAGSFLNARKESEANRWVTHTHEVIEALQALASGLGTAESALRGYALSGDPLLLADVGPGMELMRTSLARVDAANTPLDGPSLMAATEVEDLIGLVDVQLQGAASQPEAAALWRRRIALLEDLGAIRTANYSLATTGPADHGGAAQDSARLPDSWIN